MRGKKTHGKTGTRLHRIWRNIKYRCYTPSCKKFYCYGGRGITVCEEWRNSFEAFYNWAMNNGYADNLTIDRIDNNGNYEPSNCRWATVAEQNNNMSHNIKITYAGKTQNAKQWATETGICYTTLLGRLKKGYALDAVFKR